MSDGVLKSDPEQVWHFYTVLNKCVDYLDSVVEDVQKTFNHLSERIEKKQKETERKLNDLEDLINAKRAELGRTEDEKERAFIQAQIDCLESQVEKIKEMIYQLKKAFAGIPDTLSLVEGANKKCKDEIRTGKKVVNAYLKLIEIESVAEEFHDVQGMDESGRYGTMEYRGTTFYYDNSNFCISDVDKDGRTNLQRMKSGRAPIGVDGNPIELHHMIQTESGGIIEVLGNTHRKDKSVIHINTSDIPSGINRSSFDVLRAAYWKRRAGTFL